MDMEARVRAFAAVAREGSFSRAAGALYVSQPAVSKHVASLEAELGTQLVLRGRAGATLTPAGQILADYVLRAEALLANARRALAAGADAQIGTLAIAASGVPGTYLLPRLLARFRADHPAVEFDFRVSTSGGALELVRAHEVELAVVGGMTVPPELESEPLVEDEVVLVGPPSLGGRRLRGKDLEKVTWISREQGSATRAAVEAARWQIGLRTVQTLDLPSWEAVKLAVASGSGIAAISRFGLEHELAAGTLVVLDVPRWKLDRTISLVVARDVPLTPPAERFRGLLRAAFVESAPEAPPNSNLPAQTTSLIGRARELDQLVALTRREDVRLVTLTGPGGSGKTRLALEVGSRLVDDFADGVYLVSLAAVREPELVLPSIADALQLTDPSDLVERLSTARLLLVLDNFEQVVDAGPALADLLSSSSGLSLLVTSRKPLRLAGEHEYCVDPLELDAAVELFVDRARAAKPRFAPDDSVRLICERLDCLPLAVELAAARVRALPPSALIERFDRALPILVGGPRDVPDRQRTLRATIEWSYDLLEEPERTVFPRLAVFGGGWSLTDAEEVCEADAPTLETLVDQSLLRQESQDGAARFSMLETVREFAEEQLVLDRTAAALRRRHAEHFVNLAQSMRPLARGPREKECLDRLMLDLDNLRAALRSCVAQRDPRLGLTLAEALEPLWVRGLRQREGLRWFEQLFGLRGDVPDGVRGASLAVAGRLAVELRDTDLAKRWYRKSLELTRATGDDVSAAWALHGLGHVAWEEGKLVVARKRFEESLALFLRLGEHAPAGGRLTYLAAVAREQGDTAAARLYLEGAREHYALAGDASGVSGTVHELGEVALDEGRYGEALRLYREALDIAGEAVTPRDVCYILAGIASVLSQLGRRGEAARLWGAACRLEAELDVGMMASERERYERRIGELDAREVAAGGALSTDEAVALAVKLTRASGS